MAIHHISEYNLRDFPKQASPFVLNSFELLKLKAMVFGHMFKNVLAKTGNPFKAVKVIQQLRTKYQNVYGAVYLNKVAKVEDRLHWRLAAPGFPSKAINKRLENEINRLIPGQTRFGMQSIIFAITKKCRMNCEHCFEWDNLNKKDVLSTDDIIQTVIKYQEYGTTQMMFSGGEPLLRINDIYKILEAVRKDITDFWIITSGLGLSAEVAARLKTSGLTGVLISVDHHVPNEHDKFRGYESAFDNAMQAVCNANRAGLVTAFSLCARKEYVSNENLSAYMDLARNMGVSFVQIIEARAAGKYFGKEVKLDDETVQLLEKYYTEYNSLNEFKDYPIINYFGYHQRRVGCFGAGNRFFYIDTDGNAQSCPVCANKAGKVTDRSADEIVDSLAKTACFDYEKTTL
ncbi:MAG: radical SAM protein [Chitinophagales bacterium]|nr:radical SAM protein [Chitinophagales bacterium]